MREILFRGFYEYKNGKETIYLDSREIKGKWVYGFLYITSKGEYEIVYYSSLSNIEHCTYVVIPETVGQFTGLTDKNDKRIFEGDICTLKKWNNLKFSVKHEGCTWYLVNEKCINCFCLSIYKAAELEVIGNVFCK